MAHADRILTELRDAVAEVGAIAACAGGRVTLGSFPTATASFAARAVATFRDRYPDVEVRFVDGEPAESIVRLRARELDLAVVFDLESWPVTMDYSGTVVASETDVQLIDFCDDPFLLLVPRGHRLAQEPVVTLPQLADEAFIGSSFECAPWGRDLAVLCRRRGFEPNFELLYSSIDFSALQAFVAAGLGLTLLPRLATGHLRDDVVLRPLEEGPARRVKIALPARSFRSPVTTAMIDVLREVANAVLGIPAGCRDRIGDRRVG